MTDKIKNYTKEQEASMMAEYKLNPTRDTVRVLAEEFKKPEKSIIAKLVALKVYVKAERKTKSGKPVVRKSELVKKINEHFGLELPSLVKATKTDLENLVNTF